MHRTVAAALVAALALGVASCGGAEPPLTRAQLLRRVELACRAGQTETQTRSRAGRGPNNFLTAILAGQHVLMDRIKDLNPPSAAKADFDAYKESLQQRIDLFERVQSDAARVGLRRAVESVRGQGEAVSRRVEAAAKRLGASACV